MIRGTEISKIHFQITICKIKSGPFRDLRLASGSIQSKRIRQLTVPVQ